MKMKTASWTLAGLFLFWVVIVALLLTTQVYGARTLNFDKCKTTSAVVTELFSKNTNTQAEIQAAISRTYMIGVQLRGYRAPGFDPDATLAANLPHWTRQITPLLKRDKVAMVRLFGIVQSAGSTGAGGELRIMCPVCGEEQTDPRRAKHLPPRCPRQPRPVWIDPARAVAAGYVE